MSNKAKRTIGRYGVARVTIRNKEIVGNQEITYDEFDKVLHTHPSKRPHRVAKRKTNPWHVEKRRSQHTK